MCTARRLPAAGTCTVNTQVCERVGEGDPGNTRHCGSGHLSVLELPPRSDALGFRGHDELLPGILHRHVSPALSPEHLAEHKQTGTPPFLAAEMTFS